VTADVVRGRDGDSGFFLHRNTGAVDASCKARTLEFVHPGAEIGVVSAGEATTFLDVQKNNCSSCEAFFFRSGGSFAGVLIPFHPRIGFTFELAAVWPAIPKLKIQTHARLEVRAFPSRCCAFRRAGD